MVAMFILGILFGWLLEVLFVKFVLGKKRNSASVQASATATETADTHAEDATSAMSEMSAALEQCETDKTALDKALADANSQLSAEQAAHEKTQADLAALVAQAQEQTQAAAVEEVAQTAQTEISINPDADDDLTKLAGIGPKIASLMKAAGIGQFTQIADTDVDTLCEALTQNNIPYSKATVATWAEQARYASQGDWQGLKSYQEGLKS